jgi:hypothetical protein
MSEKNPVPDKLIWEAPAPQPAKKKGSKWQPVADQLKVNPGRWALIGRHTATSIVTIINKGEVKCFAPAGSFEATARNYDGRWTADVYARYVGPHQEYA